VDVEYQGQGIASALVAAAEKRLASACEEIQMEYEFDPRDPESVRLRSWYEGKLGFVCRSAGSRGGPEFRKCRKRIPEEIQRTEQRDRFRSIKSDFLEELKQLEALAT